MAWPSRFHRTPDPGAKHDEFAEGLNVAPDGILDNMSAGKIAGFENATRLFHHKEKLKKYSSGDKL